MAMAMACSRMLHRLSPDAASLSSCSSRSSSTQLLSQCSPGRRRRVLLAVAAFNQVTFPLKVFQIRLSSVNRIRTKLQCN